MSVDKTEAVLKVNGQSVSLEAQQILSLIATNEVNKIPTARILLKDGEVDIQDFPLSNRDLFIPGSQIEILLGSPSNKASIFKGIITKHSLKVRKEKPSVLIVECKHEAVKLTIGRKSRYFNEISDSDLIQQIFNNYQQLSVQIDDTANIVVHDQMVQYYTTDWDLINMRAEALGKYLFIHDTEVVIQEPQLSETPVITLGFGEPSDSQQQSRIWEFDSEMEARNQFESIATSGWDFAQQSLVEGTNSFTMTEPGNVSSGDLSQVIGLGSYQLHHLGRMLEGELNAFADAVKQKSILNKNIGRVKFDGRADVKPGDMVTLNGVGDRFNGNVFVSRVHHSFEPGRWFTEIQFGLPYEWFYQKQDIVNPPALGLLPGFEGLQVGKVIQLKDTSNPDPNFRIKVSIPGTHKADEGVWARVAHLNAGDQKGVVFLPNLEDEVIIGFIGQDVREPVILGSLFSQSASLPSELDNDDNNYKKGIITNNDHKILIDEQSNTLTLETAGGAKVVLDDQGSKITLSIGQSEIELGQAELKIKSTSIKLEAQTIDIKGNAATSINSPSGGFVKLGTGSIPAVGVGTPISIPTSQVGPGPNVKVLI